MNTRKYLHATIIAAFSIVMLLASCSEGESDNVEYIPFQETADGRGG